MEELISEHGQAIITAIMSTMFWIMTLYVLNVLLEIQLERLQGLVI